MVLRGHSLAAAAASVHASQLPLPHRCPQFDKFDQLKPGLSSYADNPPAAAESLGPLLELAEKTIPKEAQKQTSIMVRCSATGAYRAAAGRLLREQCSALVRLESCGTARGACACMATAGLGAASGAHAVKRT